MLGGIRKGGIVGRQKRQVNVDVLEVDDVVVVAIVVDEELGNSGDAAQKVKELANQKSLTQKLTVLWVFINYIACPRMVFFILNINN